MAEAFQYCELWSGVEAAGGIRLGFFMPLAPKRVRRTTGDDAFTLTLPKANRLAALAEKGCVVREVLSADGATVREWPVDTTARGSGTTLVVTLNCIGLLLTLTNYPITTTDADGFVYTDAPAIQLTPSTIFSSFVLAGTPSWLATGTVTPTALAEIPFSQDTALSGARRIEQLIPGYETSLRRNGGTQYLVDYAVLGGSATAVALRTAKNIKTLTRTIVAGQVTRVNQIQGASGDDGPTTIAWAYWEVVSTSGAGPFQVVLKAIHGGDGPIKYDNQLNHALLPGGANSLYLAKANGTFIQITGSTASTQAVTVSSLTGITAGDWVRVVASATGKHLTSLDAPVELAAYGVLAGAFTSAWDDTVCVVKNPLMADWASTAPDGWTGGGITKTTTAGNWLTAGQAILINTALSADSLLASPPSRTWFIRPRRTTYSAATWIRLRALPGNSGVVFQIKVNGTVVGSPLLYAGPANIWVQLKLEGLDLSAYVGTTVTLSVELRNGDGFANPNILIDSMYLGPSLTVRGVTIGANASRTWQQVNNFLDDNRGLQVSFQGTFADLARAGLPAQTDITLGGQALIADDELGPVTTRILEIDDDPTDPSDTTVTFSTLPSRLSRIQVDPAPLVIPLFDPISATIVATTNARNAAMQIKAKVTASDATTATVTLEVLDTLGGSPAITPDAFGCTIASGSGIGPYVVNRPASGAGVGRVAFTATLAGRTSVWDAVDIPEQDPPTITLSSLPSGTKSVRLSPSGLIPLVNGTVLAANADTSVQSQTGANVEQYQMALDMLPEGCTIIQLSADITGFVEVDIMRNNGTSVGNVVGSGGFSSVSTSLSEAIGTGGSANRYTILVSFNGGSVPADRKFRSVTVYYTSPNLQATT